MRRSRKGGFVLSIITLLIIIILSGTIYFALDVFGIIKVPAKYSIASLFYSQIEIIASANTINDIIITEDTSKVIDSKEEEKEDIENEIVENTTSEDVENPLNELLYYESLVSENTSVNIATSQIDVKRFYYNQLDEYGKIIYDEMYNNKDQLKTGEFVADYGDRFNDLLQDENGSQILNNALNASLNALVLDNPDLFYIDINKMYLLTKKTTRVFSTTYEVSISGNGENYLETGFNNAQDVENAINEVENIKNVVINNTHGDTIEKIRIVHDYLIDTVEYDGDAGDTKYDIYGTLINRRAVCEGYAKAFKYIMNDLDIPCIIVCGTGTNSSGLTETHAWNYVKLDDVWYAMDVTWDDPVIIGNTGGDIPDIIKYANFLVGSDKFFTNHVQDANLLDGVVLSYPELSTSNY